MLERQSQNRYAPLVWGVGGSSLLIVVVLLWMSGVLANRFAGQKPLADRPNQRDHDIEPLTRPPLPSESYVGSEVCATCHSQIARTYQRHPMSRSMATLQASSPIEDYQKRNPFVSGGCDYRIERKAGKLIHHESLSDSDGTELYDISTEILFSMGSGARGRSYLMSHGDILTMSSIGWYTGKAWDLSPGYDPHRHQHFNRRVSEACLQCHSGRVNTDRSAVDHFPAPQFLEAAISCERCHGPGEQHVAYRQVKEQQQGADPIVNPARLSHAEREAVCYQCHLQASERILRYGRSHQDFRPGQKINDIWTVFLKGAAADSGNSAELVTQVEQMQASRCFQKSEGRMGCTSCHDPHDFPEPESRLTFYQNKCLTCHAEQGCALPAAKRDLPPARGSCVACHMPQLNSEDVPHTSQSDHRIPRRPTKTSPPNQKFLTVFQEIGFQLSEIESERARGLVLSLLAEESNNPQMAVESERLLMRPTAAAPDDVPVLEGLGAACLMQSRHQDAEEYWKKILQTSPDHEQALLRLGILTHDSGRLEEARDFLSRFLKINPTQPQALFRKAHVLGELGEFDSAISFGKQALARDPRRLPLYEWISQTYAKQGDRAASEHYLELRDRISERLTTEPGQ